MKVQLESTSQIVKLVIDGVDVPARLWEGHTERGTPVHCFITRISSTVPPDDSRVAEFEIELKEQRPPTVPGIPLRMIL